MTDTQPSLFSSTSAFVQGELLPPPPPRLVQPLQRSPSQQLAEIAELLEDAIAAATDTELLPILHEALELARDHA